jgi:hypothetical protein
MACVSKMERRIDPLLGKDLDTRQQPLLYKGMAKHASATTELLLETMFSIQYVQRCYK